MPHIALPEGVPGISSGFAFRPETARPLRDLAHQLLHLPGPLPLAERELIAAYVSTQNDCFFCATSHGAAATAHLAGDPSIVKCVTTDPSSAPISAKLKALLSIAGKVRLGGKNVTAEDIARARAEDATDIEIHDTVLIAAAFCMFNRYVDGLATWQPRDESMYTEMGKHLAEHGYAQPSGISR